MENSIKDKADSVIANTYARFPLTLVKGTGCTVEDAEGKVYTDFVSGIAVCNLGHAHPAVSKAITEQAETLIHVSNLYYTKPQTDLAAWLVKNSFADKVFFGNSGAEANEAAIKLARKYFAVKGEDHKNKIITMQMSFHGRTMATLSATGQDKIKEGFSPILEGFDYVPFNDINALKDKLDDDVCAVMLEPVQGEGGVCCPDPDYLKAVRAFCDEKGILLIFDEIQTGMGRTGTLFAYENYGVEPDIMTLAKALGNGLPIGAMLATDRVMSAFTAGSHASTFGGTPLVTAGAFAVAETFDKESIVDKGKAAGDYFKAKLETLKDKYDFIEDVRGKGLLLGMKIQKDGASIVNKCLEKGYLINCIQGSILRFIPPLIISENDIDGLIDCLNDVFENEVFENEV